MKGVTKFSGSTTVGKKGQVVIPMETRKKMNWKEGDKLLVFELENGTVAFTKLEQVKEFVNLLEKKMKRVKQYIKKSM